MPTLQKRYLRKRPAKPTRGELPNIPTAQPTAVTLEETPTVKSDQGSSNLGETTSNVTATTSWTKTIRLSANWFRLFKNASLLFLAVYLVALVVNARGFVVETFGYFIHENDPWWFWRMTQWVRAEGIRGLLFRPDHLRWYPLPFHAWTIQIPGLPIMTAWIWHVLHYILGLEVRLVEVACRMSDLFAVYASIFTALWAFELTDSIASASASAIAVAWIPIHASKTPTCGMDNDIAVTAMLTGTLWLWSVSQRGWRTVPIGFLTGISYAKMRWTWSGAFLVQVLIGGQMFGTLMLDWIFGRFKGASVAAHAAYLITAVLLVLPIWPVTGRSPFYELAIVDFAALGVGIWFALTAFLACRLNWQLRSLHVLILRLVPMFLCLLLGIAWVLTNPLSNPIRVHLLGSSTHVMVQEQRKASAEQLKMMTAGMITTLFLTPLVIGLTFRRVRPAMLLGLYATAIFLKRGSMTIRSLIIVPAPIALINGLLLGGVVDALWHQLTSLLGAKTAVIGDGTRILEPEEPVTHLRDQIFAWISKKVPRWILIVVFVGLAAVLCSAVPSIWKEAYGSTMTSLIRQNPKHMFLARVNDSITIIRDYRDGFEWAARHTDPHARVMSWWDYGYQVTGLMHRASHADGLTEFDFQLGFLGKTYYDPPRKSHKMVQRWADYVMVETQQDAAKSISLIYAATRAGMMKCGGAGGVQTPCKLFLSRGHRWEDQTRLYKQGTLGHMTSLSTQGPPSMPSETYTLVYSSKFDLFRIYKVANPNEQLREFVERHRFKPNADVLEMFTAVTEYELPERLDNDDFSKTF